MTRAPALAKLSAPAVSKVLLRTRLFRQLDNARKRPVIWITAPPGAGKTMLASSYLAACKLRNLWYQMDEGDNDIATFFHYLGLAAKQAAPRYRKPLPHLTPEYLAGLSVFARRYFEALALRLKSPCVLVFDNYQDISAESALHGVLCEGLSALPEGFTTIVLSRTGPPVEAAYLRANENMAIIGWEDLRLTEIEAEGIMRLRKPKGFKPADIAPLHEKTRGWAAGLALLLEQGKTDHLAAHSLQDSTPQVLFDYFAGEIFAKLEAETQDVLLTSAFLPKMTANMLAQLTDFPEAGRLLADLHRKNYFTLKHVHAEPMYEYHPLFREFLLARARTTYTPERLIEVKKKAAGLLEADGQIEPAVALAQESRSWNDIARLSLGHAQSLIVQGRSHTLEAWLRSLPPEVLARTPWLAYWLGVCRLPFAPVESRQYFEQAYRHFKSCNDLPGVYRAWCAVVDSFIYAWAHFKPLDPWIAEMEELLRTQPGFPTPAIEAQVACGMFLALMYPQPHHPDLPLWEQRVWRIMQTSEDVQLRMKLGNHLLVYYTWWIGDLAKAELLVNTQRSLMQMPGNAPLVRVTWHTMAGAYYWMSAANQECIDCVDQGIEIARTSGVHVWDTLLCAQGVFASLSSGRMDTAARYFKYMESLQGTSRPMDTAVYHYLAAWDSFMRRNLPAAHEQARLAVSMAEEAGARFPAAVFRNAFARVVFYLGKREEAQALVRQTRAEGRSMRAQSIEYMTSLVEAEWALERHDEGACLEHLRRCLAVGKKQGFQNHSWWRSGTMSHLYAIALEHGIEVDYVRTLIHKRRLSPPEGSAPENWPWPVKIHTFGLFALELDGKPVAATRRGGIGKPLELLKAIVALGGRGVSQAALTEALWPEAEGDRARSNFDTALHRLRKLLDTNQALILDEGKLSLDPRYCWVDIWALEQGLQPLEQCLQSGTLLTPAQLHHATHTLPALYRGPFLSEEDTAWSLAPREKWQRRMLNFLRRLGRYCEDKEMPEPALGLYEQGIILDPRIEEFYQHLMRLYQRLGRRAEALATYARCRRALQTLLKILPSPATERLYQDLHKS